MTWRQWCVTGAFLLAVAAMPRLDSPQARSISPVSLAGNWGISFVGQSVPSLQPESGIGVAVLDAQGGISGVETFNTGTAVCEVALSGTYTVEANGTGRMTISSVSPIPGCAFTFHAAFVILDRGTVLRLVGTEPGFVILNEEWRRRPDY